MNVLVLFATACTCRTHCFRDLLITESTVFSILRVWSLYGSTNVLVVLTFVASMFVPCINIVGSRNPRRINHLLTHRLLLLSTTSRCRNSSATKTVSVIRNSLSRLESMSLPNVPRVDTHEYKQLYVHFPENL